MRADEKDLRQTNFSKHAKISTELFALTLCSKGNDKKISGMVELDPGNGVRGIVPTNSVLKAIFRMDSTERPFKISF
jgi:hypothetical protein